jgi:hypothetical protein
VAIPFATAGDLAARLGRAIWTDSVELEQVETFLADASDLLRAEIGWQVYPPTEVTLVSYPDRSGRVVLSGSPIGGLVSVTDADDVVVDPDGYVFLDGVVHIAALGPLTLTYTVGYEAVPPELVAWTCVVAAQMLARATDGTMILATPSSESLGGDYRVSYSTLQQSGDLPIPERVLQRLRSTYGQAVYAQ